MGPIWLHFYSIDVLGLEEWTQLNGDYLSLRLFVKRFTLDSSALLREGGSFSVFQVYLITLSICFWDFFDGVDANSSLIGYNWHVTVNFALEEGKNMLLYSTKLDVNDCQF